MACTKKKTGFQQYKIKAGLYLMLAEQVKFSANSAPGKSTSQSPKVELKKQSNTYLTEWCIHLICPYICGWYEVDKAYLQPRIKTSSCQKHEVKYRSRSEINLCSILCFTTIVSKNTQANSSVVKKKKKKLNGIKYIFLLILSIK